MTQANLDRAYSALADSTRRAIIARLAQGEVSVTELAEPFAISLPAVSRHLRVLERAALVSQRREGQFRICSLNWHGLKDASEWLGFYRRFWSESLDRLDAHLKSEHPGKEKAHGKRHRH
jgi:DNA-binding transcriptional ArsR family regulator